VNPDQRSVAQPRQVTLLLFFAAVLPYRHDAGKQVRAQGKNQAAIVAAVSERLQGDRTGERLAAAAAILLGHRQTLDADLGAPAPQLARERLFAIPLDDVLVQDFAREPNDVLAENALLFAG
jgi:hypothetical protein